MLNHVNMLGFQCFLFALEKLVMIIGGYIDGAESWTADIELVSLDENPVPECLKNLNPFPFGTIFGSAGAAMESGT